MKDVLIITGPTASGKTKLAFLVAKNTGGQIILADSMKVYREADIATAKPSAKYQKEVKYHLIDILDPVDRYNVGSFYQDACIIIDSLHKKNILPIITGGTSLYIAKLLEGLADIPEVPVNIIDEFKNESTSQLYEKLKEIDPERAEKLHPNMRKRIIRALGVYKHSGKKMSELLLTTKPLSYNFIVQGIKWKREALYQRINSRVDKMLKNGLLDETKKLYSKWGFRSPVFEGLGYKQLIPYIKGEIEIEDAVEEIKKATRNYAKTQLTWWRNRDILWLDGNKLISSLDEFI